MEQATAFLAAVGLAIILHGSVWIGCSPSGTDASPSTEGPTTLSTDGYVNASSEGTPINGSAGGGDGGQQPGNQNLPGDTSTQEKAPDTTTTTAATTTRAATTEEALTTKAKSETKPIDVKTNTKTKKGGIKKEVIVGLSAGFGFGLLVCIFVVILWNCCCNKLCGDGAAKIMPVDFRRANALEGNN